MSKTVIPFNVSLTKKEISRISEFIINNRNANRACLFAGLNDRTLPKALKGKTKIKNYQRDRLMEFCDLVEGKTAA